MPGERIRPELAVPYARLAEAYFLGVSTRGFQNASRALGIEKLANLAVRPT